MFIGLNWQLNNLIRMSVVAKEWCNFPTVSLQVTQFELANQSAACLLKPVQLPLGIPYF